MIALLGGVASWGTVQPVLARKHGREEAMTSSRLLHKLMMMDMKRHRMRRDKLQQELKKKFYYKNILKVLLVRKK